MFEIGFSPRVFEISDLKKLIGTGTGTAGDQSGPWLMMRARFMNRLDKKIYKRRLGTSDSEVRYTWTAKSDS